MKSHTSEFKEEIKTLGKQQSVRITYKENNVTKTLTDEDINSVTPNYEASLLKSVMKVLELDSNISIPKDTEIKFEYGLLVNGAYEYLDYGNYIVAKEPEKQEDTLSYKITCYDKMLYSMKDYEHIDITYPCTIKQYLVALCNKIGLQFKDSDFANANREITSELFMTINEDGTYSSMGYTYRDVLDQIAETTGGCICMTLDDKVEVRYINKTINYETSKKSTNIEFESSVKEIVKIQELDGKSTQDGTPTPSNPVEIKSIGDEGTLNIEQSSSNLFDASKITNTTISVLDSGKIIKMPIDTSGNGYTQVGTNLKGVCPKLEVGDTVYLLGDTTSQINKFIYLGGNSKFTWGFGRSRTLTENDLNANFVLYGNNFEKGETEQVTISNLRIVKNASDKWEQYFNNTYTLPLSEPLRSLSDDIKDTFEIDGIHRRVGSKIITMNDIAKANTSYSNVVYAQITKPNNFIGYNNYNYNAVLCNKAESLKLSGGSFDTNKMIGKINTEAHKTMFWVGFPIGTTLAEMKTQLNGMIILYELKEEIIEPYTDEQKEVINSMVTEKGTNIFELESNAILNYPVNYDTINEEYINDTNVNFGEKYRTY